MQNIINFFKNKIKYILFYTLQNQYIKNMGICSSSKKKKDTDSINNDNELSDNVKVIDYK
jgi:hypothetical protein